MRLFLLLLFSAFFGLHVSVAQTPVLVEDINPGNSSSSYPYPLNLTSVNGISLFMMNDEVHGNEIWRSDGTKEGTYILKDINPGIGSSNYYGVGHVVNGVCVFIVKLLGDTQAEIGRQLWRSDGTVEGTYVLMDYPGELALGNGVIFLAQNDGLWRTDGTIEGTYLLHCAP